MSDWPPPFTMRRSDGLNIVESRGTDYNYYERTYATTPKCGGGLCYSVGLKRCVKCGSTAKPQGRVSLEDIHSQLRSAGIKPRPKMKCNLTSKLCLENNPSAERCSVRIHRNGSCICDCLTGRGLGSRGLAPGVRIGDFIKNTPGMRRQLSGEIIPTKQIAALPEPVRNIAKMVADAYDGFIRWANSWTNIWGQKPIEEISKFKPGEGLGGLDSELQMWYMKNYSRNYKIGEMQDKVRLKKCPVCKTAWNCIDEYKEVDKCGSMMRRCEECSRGVGNF